jgi:protein SCO1
MNNPQSRSLLEPRRVGMLALVVAVLIGVLALGLPRVMREESPAAAGELERKQVIDPPRNLVDFRLTDQNGDVRHLSDMQGKPVLLFFGFTHCPDVCPATMAHFRQIKRDLGEQGDDVTFVLVSVDGSRDTPEKLKAYVEQFDEDFVGLTGDEDYVREIGSDYFLFFNRAAVDGTPSAAGYLVDHTAYSYLIDDAGRLRVIYPFQAPRELIVQDLRDMIGRSGSVSQDSGASGRSWEMQ